MATTTKPWVPLHVLSSCYTFAPLGKWKCYWHSYRVERKNILRECYCRLCFQQAIRQSAPVNSSIFAVWLWAKCEMWSFHRAWQSVIKIYDSLQFISTSPFQPVFHIFFGIWIFHVFNLLVFGRGQYLSLNIYLCKNTRN